MDYPRVNYEMTEADLKELITACKPVPYMIIGGYEPRSQQENANDAWAKLGKKMNFDPMTVKPIDGKGPRFFTAVPCETEEQRVARITQEEDNAREAEIKSLQEQNEKNMERINELLKLQSKP